MAAPGPTSSCRSSQVQIWHLPSTPFASDVPSHPCLSLLTLLPGSPPLTTASLPFLICLPDSESRGPSEVFHRCSSELGTDVQQTRHVDGPHLPLDASPKCQRVPRGTCTCTADRATGAGPHMPIPGGWTPEGRRIRHCGDACRVSSTVKTTFSPGILMVMSQELLSSRKNLRQN